MRNLLSRARRAVEIMLDEFLFGSRYLHHAGLWELFAVAVFVYCAVDFTLAPVAVWDNLALRGFYYHRIDNWIVALPFWVAAGLDLVGTVLGWAVCGSALSRALRTAGMMTIVFLSAYLAVATYQNGGTTVSVLPWLCVFGVIGGGRVLMLIHVE